MYVILLCTTGEYGLQIEVHGPYETKKQATAATKLYKDRSLPIVEFVWPGPDPKPRGVARPNHHPLRR
jgi:hypothetical protein